VAIPREAHDSSKFNNLLEGLGRKRPIELQNVSKTTPKPFGYLTQARQRFATLGSLAFDLWQEREQATGGQENF